MSSQSVRDYLDALNLKNLGEIYHNLQVAALVEEALYRGEGDLIATGALAVKTGKYTGRSPEDRFFVDTPSVHDKINWSKANKPFAPEAYDKLYGRLSAYMEDVDCFVFDGYVGADPNHRLKIRVVNQYAWQNIFVHQLLIRPTKEELANFEPDFTLVCFPGFKAIPEIDGTNSEAFVILNFEKKQIIIGGTSYAGEMKKSCFTAMNFLLPEAGVLPMHCSANVGTDGETALFFGLSGTGKTTLSADPLRSLIGDDEHGWSDEGIFNFEGGCYAKCINLTEEGEPQIWNAIRFGAVVENVVFDENTLVPDFFDASITENTRVGYPLDYIPNFVRDGKGKHPKAIVFLTADAFGVLPPIAKLDVNQACYQFMSGYTSKLAGTERGITEPTTTFSACFGAPFLPRAVSVYGRMLKEKINTYHPDVYLVNTGWSGGPYGVGSRIKLRYTREMITAALSGELAKGEYKKDPIFGLNVPVHCPNVPDEVMDVRGTWADKEAYDKAAKNLAARFRENFSKYTDIEDEIKNAGPIA